MEFAAGQPIAGGCQKELLDPTKLKGGVHLAFKDMHILKGSKQIKQIVATMGKHILNYTKIRVMTNHRTCLRGGILKGDSQ